MANPWELNYSEQKPWELEYKQAQDEPAWLKVIDAMSAPGRMILGDSLERSGQALSTLKDRWNAAHGLGESYKALSDTGRAILEPYGRAFGAAGMLRNPVGTIGAAASALGMGTIAGEAARAMQASPGGVAAAQDAAGIIGGKIGGAAAQTVQERMAAALMNRAIRPGPMDAKTIEDADRINQTALENGITVSRNGLRKLASLIAQQGNEINNAVDTRTQQGLSVMPKDVASRLDQINTIQALPEQDQAAVAAAKAAFLKRHGVAPAQGPQPTGLFGANGQPLMTAGIPASNGTPIPFDVAQAEKQGTYRWNKDHYDRLSTAQIEAEKALARGYAEEMAAKAPELGPMNEQQSRYLDLQPALVRAVRRGSARSVVGPADAVTLGAGEYAAGPLGAAGTAAAKAVNFPGPESWLAVKLHKSSNIPKPGTSETAAIAAAIQQYLANKQKEQ